MHTRCSHSNRNGSKCVYCLNVGTHAIPLVLNEWFSGTQMSGVCHPWPQLFSPPLPFAICSEAACERNNTIPCGTVWQNSVRLWAARHGLLWWRLSWRVCTLTVWYTVWWKAALYYMSTCAGPLVNFITHTHTRAHLSQEMKYLM